MYKHAIPLLLLFGMAGLMRSSIPVATGQDELSAPAAGQAGIVNQNPEIVASDPKAAENPASKPPKSDSALGGAGGGIDAGYGFGGGVGGAKTFGGGGAGFGGGDGFEGGRFGQGTFGPGNGRIVHGRNVIISWSAKNDEIRGFSKSKGQWSKLTLKPFTTDRVLVPIVGDWVAAARTDDEVLAYSGKVGRWDRLTLSPGSQALPSVDHEMVTISDGDHFYTFAAANGKWTSPTDPALAATSTTIALSQNGQNRQAVVDLFRGHETDSIAERFPNLAITLKANSLELTGNAKDVDAAEKVISELLAPSMRDITKPPVSAFSRATSRTASTGHDLSSLQRAFQHAEQKTIELARRAADQSNDDQLRAELSLAVDESFEARRRLQEAELDRMKQKLETLENTIRNRNRIRNRIVKRRVEELLDPAVNWDSVSNATGFKRRVSSPGGTPVGIPGPPHIPLGRPAGDPAAPSSVSRNVTSDEKNNLDVDPAETLKKLSDARRFAEIALQAQKDAQAELTTALRPLEDWKAEWRDRYGDEDDLDIDAELTEERRESLIETRRKGVARRQMELDEFMGKWRQQWDAYQSRIRSLQLDVDQAKFEYDAAAEDLSRMKRLADRNAVAVRELRKSEQAMTALEFELKRAQERLAYLRTVETGAPNLNPATLDLSESDELQDPTAHSEIPGPGERIVTLRLRKPAPVDRTYVAGERVQPIALVEPISKVSSKGDRVDQAFFEVLTEPLVVFDVSEPTSESSFVLVSVAVHKDIRDRFFRPNDNEEILLLPVGDRTLDAKVGSIIPADDIRKMFPHLELLLPELPVSL